MKYSYIFLLPLIPLLLICGGGACMDDLARMTPANELHLAASNNDLEGIDRALAHGHNIEVTDAQGNTALHFAASYGKADAISRLLERGANPNAQDRSGRTPLHIASPQSEGQIFYRKYARTIEALLNHGALIDLIDSNGDTPLHRAAFWIIPRNVEILVRKGADRSIRNYAGKTPYDVASESYHYEVRSVNDCLYRREPRCSFSTLHQIEKIMRLLN